MRDFRLDDPLQRLDLLFLLTTFFIVLEQGMPLRIGWLSPYKVFLFLMLLQGAVLVFQKNNPLWNAWKTRAEEIYRPILLILLCILVYIVFDLFSLTYTIQPKEGILKYVSILTMGALLMWMPIYLRKDEQIERRWKHWLWAITLPGIVLLFVTAARLVITGRTYYLFNAVLIPDYNKSAFLLTTGYLSLQYLLLRYPLRSLRVQMVVHLASMFTYLSFIWWTGSRRAPALFYFVAAGIVALVCVQIWRKIMDKKKRWLYIGSFVLLSLLLLAGAKRTLYVFEAYAQTTLERLEKDSNRTPEETKLLENTKTISEGYAEVGSGALNKRKVIWNIATEELKTYSLQEWLIGKGASYHEDLFNQPANRAKVTELYGKDLGINGMDPHNFLLLELLNGGVIKAGIVAFLCLCVLIRVLKFFPQEPETALFLLLFAFVHLVNLLLSSKHGLIENKYTWLLLIAMTGCMLRKNHSTPRRQRKEHRMEIA